MGRKRLNQPPAAAPGTVVWLDELDISQMTCGWGTPRARATVLDRPLTIRGTVFQRGVGTHADSEFILELAGCADRFETLVGIDDEVEGDGSARFEVWTDGRKVADSGLVTTADSPRLLTANLRGAATLKLVVLDEVNDTHWSHADWADAKIVLVEGARKRPAVPTREVRILPPPELVPNRSAVPRLNYPRITGARPGRPFLFRIPASGTGPLHFTAEGLPDGLRLDSSTGIITGGLASAGEWRVHVRITGPAGECTGDITIVGGANALARTPPMGWNSWNVWGLTVDEAKVRAAADAIVETGLAAHGYQYVNIDDGWEAGRTRDGTILPNDKFPHMKALADYVHSRGLKFGIYSSPGPTTCGGFTGSYQHELQDARTYAAWGVDYLKYDWCSYDTIAADKSLAELKKPYLVMRDCLAQVDRDIVYSLCQYGWGKVWEWGAEVGGQLWRTTGDIVDNWNSVRSIGFRQHGKEPYAGPGHWNDPDMLVLGYVGWGPHTHYTNLTKHEQLTHMSLWCLLSAPLLIGCDLTKLDDWTLALLCNDEVIALDQDPLGRQASRIRRDGMLEVWAKPLADGSLGLGLFNLDTGAHPLTVTWEELGLRSRCAVRDLWRHEDLGEFAGEFSADIPGHGVVLVKVTPAG